MAKALYWGASNAAKKGKKAYWGASSAAKKIKKMYIGVGGVAKLFYSGSATYSSIERYGMVSEAPPWTAFYGSDATATINGDMAIFGCGYTGEDTDVSNLVSAYDSSLSLKTAQSLPVATEFAAVAPISGYALFAGGESADGRSRYNSVYAYNSNLTYIAANNLYVARTCAAGGSGGTKDFAIIAGGEENGDGEDYALDRYNTDLTSIHKTCSVTLGEWPVIVGIGDYAVILCDGYTGDDYVRAIDRDLVEHSMSYISSWRRDVAGASNGKHVLFAGGRDEDKVYVTTVDVYNGDLTKTSNLQLKTGCWGACGASTNGLAVFCGGRTSGSYSSAINDVCAFDLNLSRVNSTGLDYARADAGAAQAGDYLVVVGGEGAAEYVNAEAYVLKES